MVRGREEKDRAERKLKVSVRTVWSSELDRDTAAVTSVLISPSAGLMRCQLVVCVENLSLRLFGCKLQGLVGRSNNVCVCVCVCVCATLECKQADVLLVVPVLRFFSAFALPFVSFSCILCYGD